MTAQVACVLRSGGEYRPEHVARLARQLQGRIDGSLLCLTDMEVGIEGVRVAELRRGWPSYWSKLEVLALPPPVVYLDLDVTVVGDLRAVQAAAVDHYFLALTIFWPHGDLAKMDSSVTGWAGDVSGVVRAFERDPGLAMRSYATREHCHDQTFTADMLGLANVTDWGEVLPGRVLAWRRHLINGRQDHRGARVIVSHSRPRPWQDNGADAWLRARGVVVR